MPNVAEMAVARAKAKKEKNAKTTTSKKSVVKKNGKKVKTEKTARAPRVQMKDKKGKLVTGRDNTFTCVECGNEITGPWSYKMHLVNAHEYSRKQAGLREAK